MNMNVKTICLVSFFLVGMTFQVAMAESDPVLAEVGDKAFTVSDLERKLEEIPSYARGNFLTLEGKMKLLDRMVRTELLKQAAIKAGYEERPDVKLKLEDARERILTSEYFRNEISDPPQPSEDDIKAYYEKNKAKYEMSDMVEVRHIVLDTKSKADDLKTKIEDNDISFEDAVVDYSIDERSKADNGKLGEITRGGFFPGIGRSKGLEDTAFSLKVGKISDPVKSRKGWHLLLVDKKIENGYTPLEQVRNQIVDELLVSEDDIKREYQSNVDQYKTRKRAKIKHIQVAEEAKAKELYKKLKRGDSFDELVMEFSMDAASIKQNGSLGYLYKDGYIRGIGKDPEFESRVFALKEGEFSKPIQSKKGWHIVQVEEKIEETLKPLSEVSAQIKNKLIRDAKENAIESKFDQLKKEFNCKLFEEKLKDVD